VGQDNISIDRVQYGEVALKNIDFQPTDSNLGKTTLWVLANPALGTDSVSVWFSGGTNAVDAITAGSISFKGVDPSTPYRNVKKTSGLNATPKITVQSAPGNMVVSVLAAGCKIDGSAQSIAWLRNTTCSTEGGNGAQSTAEGAPFVDVSYAIDADHWALIGADVNAACSAE
jgi:hypothetical protein